MPPVELVLPDGSIYGQKGKVQIVAGQFDNSTGAISFRAAFPNTDRQLRSGNTGKVRISKVLDSALVVPQEATFEIQDKVFVFAVGDSNKVVSKPITIAGKTAITIMLKAVYRPEKKLFLLELATCRMEWQLCRSLYPRIACLKQSHYKYKQKAEGVLLTKP